MSLLCSLFLVRLTSFPPHRPFKVHWKHQTEIDSRPDLKPSDVTRSPSTHVFITRLFCLSLINTIPTLSSTHAAVPWGDLKDVSFQRSLQGQGARIPWKWTSLFLCPEGLQRGPLKYVPKKLRNRKVVQKATDLIIHDHRTIRFSLDSWRFLLHHFMAVHKTTNPSGEWSLLTTLAPQKDGISSF